MCGASSRIAPESEMDADPKKIGVTAMIVSLLTPS
jgi:hypothetical protein